MADDVFTAGSKIRLTATCHALDASSVPQLADPTTVTLRVLRPDGVTDTYTWAQAQITRASLGIFYRDYSASLSGYYYYRFEGTGACEAADVHRFEVPANPFA